MTASPELGKALGMMPQRLGTLLLLSFALIAIDISSGNANVGGINVRTRRGQEFLAEVIVTTKRQKDYYFSCLEQLTRNLKENSEECSQAFEDINKMSKDMSMGRIERSNREVLLFVLQQIKLRIGK